MMRFRTEPAFFFVSLLLLALLPACSHRAGIPAEYGAEVALHETRGAITLLPVGIESEPVGLLFYPGGFVKPEAYIPAMARVAARGVPVIIIRMPFDLAVLAPNRGLAYLDGVAGTESWAAGGHSLGGVMAARLAARNPEDFEGIVFIASYPAASDSDAIAGMRVLSVSASEDGLTTPDDIERSRSLLPDDAEFVVIQGGNHSGFGSYGTQRGDGEARLGAGEQHDLTAEAVVEFIRTLGRRGASR